MQSQGRARWEYLSGRVLDMRPIYCKEADEHLAKSGLNHKALQQISMLESRIGKGRTDEAETVEESILHAKQAISLDNKDGQSRCTITFEPFSDYLKWICKWSAEAFNARKPQEKDDMATANPDLHVNSATETRSSILGGL